MAVRLTVDRRILRGSVARALSFDVLAGRRILLPVLSSHDLVMTDGAISSVLLADGHEGFCRGLARAISACSRLWLTTTVREGALAAAVIERDQPDLALLDVRLRLLDGYEIATFLSAQPSRPRTRVILITALLDAAAITRATRAGAVGCLGKDASRAEICEALLAAADGVAWAADDPVKGIVLPVGN